MSDLALLIPELILVGMALALILVARRIQRTPVAVVGTVLAAMAAALASGWVLSLGSKTGFGGMIILDGYSQFSARRVPCLAPVVRDGNDACCFLS